MQKEYDKIRSTLTETSKDDDGNSVIESDQEVYDFDKITKEVAVIYRVSKPQCSCDAMYIKDDDNIYLLEFKNVRCSHVPKKSLKEKAYDSIMTLQMAFFPAYSLNDIKNKVNLVFVYNNEVGSEKLSKSDAIDKMKSKMSELSKEKRNILFGLEIYKNILYKDVFTVDRTDFIKDMQKTIFE